MKKKLRTIYNEEEICYPEDVDRILNVLEQHGYEKISKQECQDLWERYSEDYWSAGWLILPDDDEELWDMLRGVIVEEDEEDYDD